LDLSSARKPNQELKRVNVDIPIWMVNKLDQEAKRVGVTRQSEVKGLTTSIATLTEMLSNRSNFPASLSALHIFVA
jgi:hypothetical protein